MKKAYIGIAAALVAGLLLGYLIFGGSSSAEVPHNHETEAEAGMWTCSMHPQVMQPQPGSCPICGMDLIPAETGDMQAGQDQIRMSAHAMALADIRTIQVGAQSPGTEQRIRLSGKVSENTEANRVQASFFDGRIEKLQVNYVGQKVTEGQQLASIYSPGLVAAQQELLTAAPLKTEQPELYRAVRNKLRNWKLTDAQIDRIEASGQVREAVPVYATVSGTVTEVLTAEGDYVKAGQPIARLSNLSTVWAELDAYERHLGQLSVGQSVRIQSKALPGKQYQARISFIDPILDTKTRTVTVRATLENPEGQLKPGMFISGEIETGVPQGAGDVLTIPASAVLWTGERSLVYVRTTPGQPVFEMREVRLGERSGEEYAVLEGLEAGEDIVAQGAFTVDAAAQLQGKKSMMNRSGEGAADPHAGHGGMPSQAGMETWPEGLRTAYPQLLGQYLNLKDALVASQASDAREAATDLREALPEIGATSPAGEAMAAMRQHLDRLLAAGGDLERQRAEFQQISNLLIGLGGEMGSAEAPLYVQFCPMADDFKGAYWVSREPEIRNPYFGDAMLTCGEVRQTWKGE